MPYRAFRLPFCATKELALRFRHSPNGSRFREYEPYKNWEGRRIAVRLSGSCRTCLGLSWAYRRLAAVALAEAGPRLYTSNHGNGWRLFCRHGQARTPIRPGEPHVHRQGRRWPRGLGNTQAAGSPLRRVWRTKNSPLCTLCLRGLTQHQVLNHCDGDTMHVQTRAPRGYWPRARQPSR
jgi:hypothetical protein